MFYYNLTNPFDGDVFTVGDYKYKETSLEPNEVELIGASSTVPAIISIPATVTHDGKVYDVKSVGYYAFYQSGGYAAPTSIVIAEGVTSIKETAFNNLLNVTSVTFPSTLTEIVYRAFRQCEALTSVVIPEGITELEGQVFMNCYALSTVTIPSSVTSIGNSTFRADTSLTAVTVLNPTPPALHEYAFRDVTLSGVKLYVPFGSKELYEATAIWTDFDIIESEALSVNDVNQELTITIYPNPTSRVVSITSLENIINITVFTESGSVLLNSKSTQLDFSSLASGVYFVKVKTANGASVKKVIKK
jgi:hypothetical protein